MNTMTVSEKVKEQNIWETIEQDIQDSELEESVKKKLFNNLLNLKNKKINILITGATGSGKSSTINAIFDTEIAKVGHGVDPETMSIEKYELDNLTLWDSPGLGDGKEADIRHSKNIIDKLTEKDKEGKALIDLVLALLDGSSRDLGTSYQLINEVIIPNLPEKNRILVAINQCDIAMKGKGWDHEHNCPDTNLEVFLNQKVDSVRRRIQEGTSVDIQPIFYSAEKLYNISKLLSFVIKHTPKQKRAVYIENINKDPNPWKRNDELENYNETIKKSLFESVIDGISEGADVGGEIGETIGSIFGETGRRIGRAAGKVVGGFVGAVKGLFS